MQKCFGESGQAMTEMLVASAFVLIPLFLIVPIVGKYIDMQHSTVNAARYIAWERTVKVANKSDYSSGFSATVKEYSHSALKQEAIKRVLARSDENLDSEVNPSTLWRYHNGLSMLENTGQQASVNQVNGTLTGVVNGVGKVLSSVTGLFDKLIDTGRFDVINTGGGSTAQVSLQSSLTPYITNLSESSSERLLLSASPKFTARAQVYSLSWSAGGSEHLDNQVKPLVPTAYIGEIFKKLKVDVPVINKTISGQGLLSSIMLSPEIDERNLKFGHLDTSVLPRDKYLKKNTQEYKYQDNLSNLSSGNLCNDKGFCRE